MIATISHATNNSTSTGHGLTCKTCIYRPKLASEYKTSLWSVLFGYIFLEKSF